MSETQPQLKLRSSQTTFVDNLKKWAMVRPTVSAVRFLADGEIESRHLNFFELDKEARKIAASLQKNYKKGERVLLCYPPGADFVCGFLGCFYAGMIAVPIYPPGNKRGHGRLLSVLQNCGARVILTAQDSVEKLDLINNASARETAFEIIATDILKDGLAEEYSEYNVSPSELAFLQYTSGSTGNPKGAMISHGNLRANIEMLVRRANFTEHDSVVTWLPIYHDMGLIGTLLMPLYVGFPATLLPAASFIMKPIRWFQAFSKYRGTASAAPNFAYDLCVRKIKKEELIGLDLSSIRVLFNGAEPIQMAAMTQLTKMLAPAGFGRTVFLPSYGLAEATLIVSGRNPTQVPECLSLDREELENNVIKFSSQGDSKEVTSCGLPCDGIQVAIMDPETLAPTPPDRIGEIWLAGNNIAQGYWNNEEATQSSFYAKIPNQNTPFLRTGDLGFIHKNEIYVTGRLKDMLILNGRNLYPHDLEESVENAHAGVRRGCTVAFANDGTRGDEACVILEIDRNFMRQDLDSIRDAILVSVGQDHDIGLANIVFLKHGALPKTSSGKLQRRLTKARWKSKELDVIYEWIRPMIQGAVKQNAPTAESALLNETLNWLREYASTRINSRLMDERRNIPPHIALDFGNRGLLGMIVPKEYGGKGFTYREIGLISQQLAAIDLSLALLVGLNNALGIYPVLNFASKKTKERLLPGLATGRHLASFALTERGAGSNPQAIQTSAHPTPGGFLLFGEKIWIGNAAWASVISVFAKEKSTDGATGGISGFVIDSSQPGYRNGPEAMTMGMRAMIQNAVLLDGVFASEENRLGQSGEGMLVASSAMNFTRAGIANLCVGTMKRCCQWMMNYSDQRMIVTGKLLSNAVTLSRLQESIYAVEALDVLCSQMDQALDNGENVPEEIYMCSKILAPEWMWRTADWTVQLLGGRGYIESNLVPQMYRDARIIRVFEGPTETIELHLGSRIANRPNLLAEFLRTEQARKIWSQFLEQCERTDAGPVGNKYWLNSRLGRLGAIALLKAVVADATPQNTRTIQWLSDQYQMEEERIGHLSKRILEMSETDVVARVRSFATDIGEIEQSLPGEDHSMDPMLTKRSVPTATGETVAKPVLERKAPKTEVVSTSRAPIPRPKEVVAATPSVVTVEAAQPKNDLVQDEVERNMRTWIAKSMQVAETAIDVTKPFTSYGVDSLAAYELICKIEETYSFTVPSNLVWDYPTIREAAKYVAKFVSKNLSKMG